jgi:hypothetical protein
MNANCIYCTEPFDPSAGAGDHILAAQLFGLFKGDKRFRGLCPTCNNKLGRMEQIVIETSHLGFYRFRVRPKPGRPSRAGSLIPRGVSRATRPRITVETGGRNQLLELSDDTPELAIMVDQLELYDNEGKHDQLRLYPGMSADRLQSEIEKSPVKKPTTWYVNSSAKYYEKFVSLVAQVLKVSKIEEAEGVDPGIYEGYTTAEFSVTKDFYRVLAKIALHYYLVHNARGLKGNEPAFAQLRAFIMEGTGDIDYFFRTSGPRFQTPFYRVGDGMVCPENWCHVLAAAEEKNSIVAYLQLYIGPRSLPDPHYITLGQIETRLVLPRPAFGHVFQVEERTDKYAGQMLELSMTRLR